MKRCVSSLALRQLPRGSGSLAAEAQSVVRTVFAHSSYLAGENVPVLGC